MPRRILGLLVLLSLSACATRAEREAVLDNQLREMTGAPEASLLSGMGRIPDNSYQLEDGARILQWRWDTSYVVPGSYPYYGYGWGRRWGGWGGGWWGGFPPTLVRQGCIVEWTLVNGVAQRFHRQGTGCEKITP